MLNAQRWQPVAVRKVVHWNVQSDTGKYMLIPDSGLEDVTCAFFLNMIRAYQRMSRKSGPATLFGRITLS